MIKDIDLDLPDEIVKIVEKFPTKSSDLLSENSYFRYLNGLIRNSSSFLEIGYRKGIFVEVCKFYKIPSTHIDISDELLRATSSENNECITVDSLSYLTKCSKQFGLIFQDGSKSYNVRKQEYDLILEKSILTSPGVMIVDDLHYPGCRRAFDETSSRFLNNETLKAAGKNRRLGVLSL